MGETCNMHGEEDGQYFDQRTQLREITLGTQV
jgi:hypothetical protein